jgi:aspartate/methionine/tyrosine aminotransferase
MKFTHLEETSLWGALSKVGKTIETPKGIFYWSGRAAKEAEINGTIGVAQDDDGTISHLACAEEWAGAKAMTRVPKGKIFGYAPIEGVTTLREKWLKKILRGHEELSKFATLPVVTNGITHSIAVVSRLLLNSGETVLTADKSWENYEHIFTGVQGVNIESFELFTKDSKFNIDGIIKGCRSLAKKQKKVILLLNFPHNQTGFMPSEADFRELASRLHELCKEFQKVPFVLVLDDAYEGYVYDKEGLKSSPFALLFAEIPNLTVAKMDGISKVLLAYGYRVGFVTFFINSLDGSNFSDEFLKGLRSEVGTKVGGFIRGEISQANHHGQVLADALFDSEWLVEAERAAVVSRLGERWQKMMDAISDGYKKYGKHKAWADPCNGGFFCYMNIKEGIDPKDVADRLLKEKKVGIVPSEHGLRVAFSGVPKEKISRMISSIFEVVYR